MPDTANEVPFIEQLRSIPIGYRTCYAIQWDEDGRETGHRFVPVGYMMHRAADELEAHEKTVVAQKSIPDLPAPPFGQH